MGRYFTTGFSFSGTSPNNLVTAERLNSSINDGILKTTTLTDAPTVTAFAAGDYLFCYQASTGLWVKVPPANVITAGIGRASATNLLMLNNAATPDSKVDISADRVLMRSPSTGNLRLAISFSVTADIALGVAVNGLDAGTEASSTWYYLYGISDGANDRCLISASASSPTFPVNYIYQCLLGAVYNDASSNFTRFVQRGNDIGIAIASPAGTTLAGSNPRTPVGGGEFTDVAVTAANTFQTADISRCVPPNITASVRGIIGHTLTTNGTLRGYGVASSSSGALNSLGVTVGLNLIQTSVVTSNPVIGGFTACGMFDVPITTSQQIAWATNSASSSIHNMRITGFTLAL